MHIIIITCLIAGITIIHIIIITGMIVGTIIGLLSNNMQDIMHNHIPIIIIIDMNSRHHNMHMIMIIGMTVGIIICI